MSESTTRTTTKGAALQGPLAWIPTHGGQALEFKVNNHYANGTGPLEGWSAATKTLASSLDEYPSDLSKHTDLPGGHLLMQSIRPTMLASQAQLANQLISWDSTLMVGKGRYVRVHGFAKDLLTALADVTNYQHVQQTIGGITWWKETDKKWVSWIGNQSMEATQFDAQGDDPARWHFEIRGNAPSLEEAALLATWRHIPATASQATP